MIFSSLVAKVGGWFKKKEKPKPELLDMQEYYTLATCENYRGNLLEFLKLAEKQADSCQNLVKKREWLTLESIIRARLSWEGSMKKDNFLRYLRKIDENGIKIDGREFGLYHITKVTDYGVLHYDALSRYL